MKGRYVIIMIFHFYSCVNCRSQGGGQRKRNVAYILDVIAIHGEMMYSKPFKERYVLYNYMHALQLITVYFAVLLVHISYGQYVSSSFFTSELP